ncbi:GAF and ANTAR domain-containing protein [Streptomyces sp. SD11]|uniref:GAF and ANTAR domain-containing protein n=2 Tax=Streptomyces TaxID=1883 RepID=UPI00200DCC97|nr:GAF and ANTAR domain-containing protein [Streptomyces sp. LRE541]UPZ29006.1 GAF and ANTAR domain-containing protein [Streptomyces sp. LRE541]
MRHENRGGGSDMPDRIQPSDVEDRRRVTEAFTSLTSSSQVRRVPELLCGACVDLLPVTGASISITGSSTARALWCASDDTAARLAEAQYTLGDGPCQSALDRAAPVLAPDLTQGPDARRWPVFAHQAVELGVRAVFSLPLGAGALAIGTLDLYRDTAGALSPRDLRIALLARDAVTFAVLNLEAASDGFLSADEAGVASWVDAAEADHIEVHQAVGMVMVQLGVDPEQALDRLRAHAFSEGRTVTEVAQEILARTLRFHPEADDDQQKGRGRLGDEGDGDRS